MSLTSTITAINSQITTYSPAVFASVIAVEQAAHSQPGATKLQMTVNAIMAGSQIAQGVPIPSVSAIAALVNMAVSFLNAFGIFNHGSKPNVPDVHVAPVAVPVVPVPVPAAVPVVPVSVPVPGPVTMPFPVTGTLAVVQP